MLVPSVTPIQPRPETKIEADDGETEKEHDDESDDETAKERDNESDDESDDENDAANEVNRDNGTEEQDIRMPLFYSTGLSVS